MSKDTNMPSMPEPSLAVLVSSLGGQALMYLGMAPNPMTNKTEVDLDQAKYSIDLIQVLKDKTQGNLDDDERRMFDGLLYDLRMRYVEANRGE